MEEMHYDEEYIDEESEELNETPLEVLDSEQNQEVSEDEPSQDIIEEASEIDILEDFKEFIHENPEDIDLLGIREKFGYTFEQVAEGIGITDSYYRKIEKKWVGLTDKVASKLSEFYGFEIKPYIIKTQPKDKVFKKNEESTSYTTIKAVKDSPERRLHLALKKKHSELANKIVARYEVINTIKEMINDIFLKDGE